MPNNSSDTYLDEKDPRFYDGVDFIFNYLADEDRQSKYYAERGITKRFGDSFAENCIDLFNDPEFLLDKYSDEQIKEGFSYILGPRVLIRRWLWDEKNNPELRRRFILSMINVFEKLFVKKPIDYICFMWWDLLRGFDDDKDLKVTDWMYEALSKILEIDSFDCRMSALHGLGHIAHSEKKRLIENFLREHPNFAKNDYAIAAIEGSIP